MPKRRNLVLVGRNGLGKTMIAQNLCHAAVLAGYSVLFRSASALLEDLHRQSPEGRRSKLRTYANVGLLCMDEVGYLSFDDKAADLLYEVVNRRYERKPVILTTNRPFKEWNEVFPNATCIVTLLDRLLHHADVTVIDGRQLSGARKRAGNGGAAEEEMTPAGSLLDPASNPALYVSTVLTLYVDLPDTPLRANVQDQRMAKQWFDRGIALSVVDIALLLGSLRRLTRPRDVPPLTRIRSLAYFQPVSDELRDHPVPAGYLQYLRLKLRTVVDRAEPSDVQKTTFPDDR